MTSSFLRTCVACVLVAMATGVSASPIAYWFDGYDLTAASSSDINAEIATRQGGAPAPVSYVANSPNNANDYHHQMFSPGGPLQIAADNWLITPGPTTTPTRVSPNLSFKGTVGDQVIGRKVQAVVDVYRNSAGAGTYSTAALTAASSTTLADAQNKADGFSIVFVEDTFNDPMSTNSFLQVFDGSTLIGNLIPNPAGTAPGFVEIFFDDPTDGDPFNGLGTTEVSVAIDSTPVFNYSKGGGGYTDNFVTLEGGLQTNGGVPGAGLAIHDFDNLTVFSAPAIPEPTSVVLAGLTVLGLLTRRSC